MPALIGAGSRELGHPHMPRVQEADQPPDASALARGIPPLEQGTKRRPKLGASDQATHLQPQCQEPSLRLVNPTLTLCCAELQPQVRITHRRHQKILSGSPSHYANATGVRPVPGFSGRALSTTPAVWPKRPGGRPQPIVTVLGDEAIPLATTTSVLLPLGVVLGMVNLVEELVPGAIDTELQSLVRA